MTGAARHERVESSTVHLVAADPAVRSAIADNVERSPCLCIGALAVSLEELAARGPVDARDVVLLDAASFDPQTGLPRDLDIAFLVLLCGGEEGAHTGFAAMGALSRLDGLAILDRDADGEWLHEAIQLVRRGAFICDMPAIRAAAGRLSMLSRYSRRVPVEALSRRESEVLDLVAAGLSNKAIGWELTVSEGTVKAHVSHIMAKLRLANRSQLVAYSLATSAAEGLPPREAGGSKGAR